MFIALLISVAFFGVLAFFATVVARGLWHNKPGEWQARPLWWQRSVPSAVAVGWAMLIGAISTPVATGDYGVISDVFEVLLILALLVFVVGFALASCVALFGRPAVLMPPHLRTPR